MSTNRVMIAISTMLLAAAAVLVVVVTLAFSAANGQRADEAKQITENTKAVQALQTDARARDRLATIQAKESAVFIRQFLRAQSTQCHAALDADRRLGAVIPVSPDPCVITLPSTP